MSFSASNCEAEYEAILVGLDLALTLDVTRLEIRSDFQLIIGKIQRDYEVKDERMTHYLAMVEDRLKKLDEWIVRRGTRKENLKADALASIVATLPIKEAVMLPVYFQVMPSTAP